MSLIDRVSNGSNFINGASEDSSDKLNSTKADAFTKYCELQQEKAERTAEKLKKAREEAEAAREKREEEAKIEAEEEKKAEEKRKEEERNNEASLNSNEVTRYAAQLRQVMKDDAASDSDKGKQLDKIVSDDEISDGDFEKIVNLYNQRYGTGHEDKLIKIADDKLSYDYKNTVLGQAAQSLVDAAQDELESGNKDGAAMQTLSELIHNSKFDNINAAAKFVEAIVNADSAESMSAVIEEKYPDYSGDISLAEKIKKNYDLYSDENVVDIIDMYS